MFTGLVEQMGRLRSIAAGAEGAQLEIESSQFFEPPLVEGESVAVDGVCLTVVEHKPQGFTTFASPETMRRTTLGDRRPGDSINLERALTLDKRLGGHLVQGHVDGCGKVAGWRREGESWLWSVSVPDELLRYCVEKGSIALDGVSLTIAQLEGNIATIAIIPATYEATAISHREAGHAVNIEVDIIAKYVERMMGAWNPNAVAASQRTAAADDVPSAPKPDLKEMIQAGGWEDAT